jgi:hypothetical protein
MRLLPAPPRPLLPVILLLVSTASLKAQELLAGAARVDITDRTAGPVNDPAHARALVLRSGDKTVVLVGVDAVAIGGIGRIGNGFLGSVRSELHNKLGIAPGNVIINASHCHAIVRGDAAGLVVQAVEEAARRLVPVKAAAGTCEERRISENRRLKMKDGSEVDMRRAYAMPRDEDIASVGPIDPQVGLLRLDRLDGTALAIVYQFACHPIMNPPHKGSSADYPGFASKVIEGALGHDSVALFLQGCGGDINPVRYKEVSRPADAEPLGTMLGASVLDAVQRLESRPGAVLKADHATISLPRAADYEKRITAIEAEQKMLLASLRPTNIGFKAFIPLLIQQRLAPDFPSHHAQSYLHDRSIGRNAIEKLDEDNRALVEAYLKNIEVMERLTRLNTNLALLKKHLDETRQAGAATLDAEVCGLRVGDFKLVTFPGELTVEVGLGVRSAFKDPLIFVSGYTNGYLFYTPTAAQRLNKGYAQEDCDTLVAPEWQTLFERQAQGMLRKLAE